MFMDKYTFFLQERLHRRDDYLPFGVFAVKVWSYARLQAFKHTVLMLYVQTSTRSIDITIDINRN
jgi:hypothetical protein